LLLFAKNKHGCGFTKITNEINAFVGLLFEENIVRIVRLSKYCKGCKREHLIKNYEI